MAKPDWLSIDEIIRLWSEETGLDASAFREDLEAWFAAFVKQPPASRALIPGGSADATNRLMGMLGARYLERSTFQAYCEERGHPKPRFWFGDQAEESRRGKRHQSEPAPSSPEASPSRPGAEPSQESGDRDPELVAFQTRIAGLSERLEPGRVDVPGFSKPAPADQGSVEPDRKRSRPAAKQNRQQLIERAAAASEEARELKAQLEAAERRIAELTAETEAEHGSAPARPSAPQAPSPEGRGYAPAMRLGRGLQGPASYRDPGASGQLLRRSAGRSYTRARVIVVAGMAVLVVALLVWGAKTTMRLAGNEPSPPPAGTADPADAQGSADGGEPLAQSALVTSAGESQAGAAAPSGEPATGKLSTGGVDSLPLAAPPPSGSADPQAVKSGLAAAQQQIARLTAAAEASDAMIARLQDELAIARRRAEAALQSPPEAARNQTREQRLAAQALSAEVAIARRELENARRQAGANAEADAQRRELMAAVTAWSARADALKRGLEANRRQTSELTSVLETAKAEASSLREALERTEEQAAQADGARRAAEAAAAQARTALGRTEEELASLGKQLDAARGSLAEANESAAAARAETTRLRTETTRLTDELAKVNADAETLRAALQRTASRREDLTLAATAASARLAALQRDLEAAYQKIDMLGQARKSAEDEALRLREELAARQREASSAQPVIVRPVEPMTPGAAEVREGTPDEPTDLGPADKASPGGEGRAPSDRDPVAAQSDPDRVHLAEDGAAEPEIEELLAAAESLPDPATVLVIGPAADSAGDIPGDIDPVPGTQAGAASDLAASTGSQAAATPSVAPADDGLEQVAALEATEMALQTDAVRDTVAAEDLLLEPGSHVGREVVVTGSVVWHLWRYRLQSDTGPRSLVIDIKGLRPDDRTELRRAVNEAGLLGDVRIRIRGTVERQGAASYRLAASGLAVIE